MTGGTFDPALVELARFQTALAGWCEALSLPTPKVHITGTVSTVAGDPYTGLVEVNPGYIANANQQFDDALLVRAVLHARSKQPCWLMRHSTGALRALTVVVLSGFVAFALGQYGVVDPMPAWPLVAGSGLYIAGLGAHAVAWSNRHDVINGQALLLLAQLYGADCVEEVNGEGTSKDDRRGT